MNAFLRSVEEQARARALLRGDNPVARVVCEKCESDRLTLIAFQCGVLLCSTCLLQIYRGFDQVMAPCKQCMVPHEQFGLMLTTVGTIRYWFFQKTTVKLILDCLSRGYFWSGQASGLINVVELMVNEEDMVQERMTMLVKLRRERVMMSELFAYQGGWALAPQAIQDGFLKQLEVNSELIYLVDNCFFELYWLNVENF